MKKVISFVLVLALVLGSFSMAFAVPADVEGTDYEDAVTALSELGVVTGYTDGNYYPEKAVNRAEAAKLVITALGLADYAAGNTASFTDLEGYGWAKGYIGYAEALGILKGDGNGKFRPADTVSYQEMATMLVRACGYTDASLPGVWPANYVVKAKALGIMDGIAQAGDAAANRGDVAVMIYNNLENEIGYINLDNTWVANGPNLDTMLTRLDQEMFDPDGVATGTAVAGDAFVLNGTEAIADGVNVKAYYGALVVAYANADNEITGIKEVKSTFLTGEFNAEGKFVANDVEYTVVSNTSDYGVTGFANGKVTSPASISLDKTADDECTLAVKVSGKQIKNVYSQADWDGTNIKVTATMLKSLDKDNKFNNANLFTVDDNYEIDTTSFVLVGVDALADIEEDDIITTYVDAAKYITKLEVSDTVVTGEITKMSSDDKTITVAGEEYVRTTDAAFTGVVPGDEVELVLNYAGDVFSYEKVAGELENYGIVTDKYEAKGNWTSATTEYAIKFFAPDGTIKEAYFDDAISGSAATYTVGVVFKYDLNKDGEISDITTAAVTYVTNAAVSAKGVLGGYNFADDAIVIVADAVSAGNATAIDDEFVIGKAADLFDTDLTAALYVADTDTDEITFIIVKSDSTTTNKTYAVANEAYTDNTDAGYGVVVLIDGAEKTFGADANASGLVVTSAALKELKFNTDGTVKVASVTDASVWTTESTAGETLTVENGRLKTTSGGAVVDNYGIISEEVVIYVWDADNSVWTAGDTSDLELDIESGNVVTLYRLDSDNAEEITHITLYI
ncbi:MAG: S-layer homology domain-containing protein [Clostridiales bacterium]|nr:S-layer homology domain-containing protein [Clostridiales bacterium]